MLEHRSREVDPGHNVRFGAAAGCTLRANLTRTPEMEKTSALVIDTVTAVSDASSVTCVNARDDRVAYDVVSVAGGEQYAGTSGRPLLLVSVRCNGHGEGVSLATAVKIRRCCRGDMTSMIRAV